MDDSQNAIIDKLKHDSPLYADSELGFSGRFFRGFANGALWGQRDNVFGTLYGIDPFSTKTGAEHRAEEKALTAASDGWVYRTGEVVGAVLGGRTEFAIGKKIFTSIGGRLASRTAATTVTAGATPAAGTVGGSVTLGPATAAAASQTVRATTPNGGSFFSKLWSGTLWTSRAERIANTDFWTRFWDGAWHSALGMRTPRRFVRAANGVSVRVRNIGGNIGAAVGFIPGLPLRIVVAWPLRAARYMATLPYRVARYVGGSLVRGVRNVGIVGASAGAVTLGVGATTGDWRWWDYFKTGMGYVGSAASWAAGTAWAKVTSGSSAPETNPSPSETISPSQSSTTPPATDSGTQVAGDSKPDQEQHPQPQSTVPQMATPVSAGPNAGASGAAGQPPKDSGAHEDNDRLSSDDQPGNLDTNDRSYVEAENLNTREFERITGGQVPQTDGQTPQQARRGNYGTRDMTPAISTAPGIKPVFQSPANTSLSPSIGGDYGSIKAYPLSPDQAVAYGVTPGSDGRATMDYTNMTAEQRKVYDKRTLVLSDHSNG